MRFCALDGWRGLCALFVALFHLNTLDHFHELSFVRHSFLFVDFFFVLSGFVISYAYTDKITTAQDAARFIIRRFGRLWPLHATLLATLIILELVKQPLAQLGGTTLKTMPFAPDSPALPEAILTNVFFIHSLNLHSRLTWNYPSWSISTEFFAYLVFAAISLAALRSFVFPLALGAAAAVLVMLLSKNYLDTTYDYGAFRCLYGFFVGHLVFRIWKSGRIPLRHATAVEIGVVALGVAAVVAHGKTPWSYISPLMFGLIVWVFAHSQGAVSRIMESRPMLLLGDWSYSIYMVHAVIVLVLNRALAVLEKLVDQPLLTVGPSLSGASLRQLISFGGPWTMDALALAYLAVVISAASLTYRFIEVPGREFFNRLAVRKSQPAI